MSPRVRAALAALTAVACFAGGDALADAPVMGSMDADEATLAGLALGLAAAPVPPLGQPEPRGNVPAREPRVDLAVTFAARSVVFDELPRIRMTFGRSGPLPATWRIERRNLPVRVEPGVEYRDVEVRLTLSSTVDEFESLIEDATRVAAGIRVEEPAAPVSAEDPPPQRARVAPRWRMDAINAERARAGLLPRKSPPGKLAPGSSQPVGRALDPLPGAPPAPALSQAQPAAPGPARPGAPAAAAEAAVAESDAPTVFRLSDVVLAALRSRSPADDADRTGRSAGPDTSLEALRVRVRDPLVESNLVGRAGELTVTVRSGSAEGSQQAVSAPAPAVAAAVRVGAPAPALNPGAAPAQPPPSSAPAPVAPAFAAAQPPRDVPSGYGENPGLLARWRTARGEVIERTLDPSGVVVQRQVDPPGGWERAIDVSKLTLVSQRRAGGGEVVQVVQDVSGAHIEVMRDPIGRFLQARVLRR